MQKNLLLISSCTIFSVMFSFGAYAQTFSTKKASDIKATAVNKSVTTSSSAGSSSGNGVSISSLTNGDISSGLKEALELGAKNATSNLSAKNGYYGNPAIKILFPPEVQEVEKKLRAMGMGSVVDDAIVKLNRAAEDASKQALPIFVDAITSITINDAVDILKGGNNSATQFLQKKTTSPLTKAFTPTIEQSLNKVGAAKAWKNVFDTYNQIPFVKPVNSNLTSYVTEQALSGLFVTIGQEEVKIRKNPAGQASSLLQKVFGAK